MKFALLFILILCSTIGQAQKLKFPAKPYELVIGKYRFVSETVIEKSPDLSGGFLSENFAGLQLKLSGDTMESVHTYLDGDSVRTWTYLFQHDTLTIHYPPRIQKVRVRLAGADSSYIRYDTTDHFDINKLADTISVDKLKRLLFSEMEVYNGSKKLKVRRIGARLLWPDGKQFYTNYEKKRIADYPRMVDMAKSLSANGYIIIDAVWFYNLDKEQDEMTGAIGWFIR